MTSPPVLTEGLADGLGERGGRAEGDELVVLVELAEGHPQAVVGEDEEDLVQEVGGVLEVELWNQRGKASIKKDAID